ncbi:LEU7 protein, partial [Cephalopterus ornatus]|nr:LEU7 protein [Cephalopterus ornatus]
MVSLGALLVSVGHQAGALRSLWAAAAPQLSYNLPRAFPHPNLQHQEVWPSLAQTGEELEVSEHGGAQELKEERKILGKSPKEGEESGDLSLSAGESRPGRLAQPRLAKYETLQETALRSNMFQLVEATSCLLDVEHLLFPLLQKHPLPLHPKESIGFRNICSHMALQREGQFVKNFHEAYQCFKTITEKLICSLAVFPSDSYIPVRSALREILQNPLAM